MKNCPSCNARNDDQAIVCSLCSARLAGAPRRGSTRALPDATPHDKSGPIIEPRLWQAGKPRVVRSTVRVAESFYLVPPFGPPLRLEPSQKPLVLGRDQDCDVAIASPTVSRRHAEIRFEGTPLAPSVRDLGTKNGTRVNGRKLVKGSTRTLKDGDILRVGDVTAIYRLLPPGEDASTLRPAGTGTVQMQVDDPASGARAPETMSALKGDLTFFPMPELLSRLARLRASGTLTVEFDGVKGKVAFEAGRVATASVSGMDGPAAIQAISDLQRGSFKFEPAKA